MEKHYVFCYFLHHFLHNMTEKDIKVVLASKNKIDFDHKRHAENTFGSQNTQHIHTHISTYSEHISINSSTCTHARTHSSTHTHTHTLLPNSKQALPLKHLLTHVHTYLLNKKMQKAVTQGNLPFIWHFCMLRQIPKNPKGIFGFPRLLGFF